MENEARGTLAGVRFSRGGAFRWRSGGKAALSKFSWGRRAGRPGQIGMFTSRGFRSNLSAYMAPLQGWHSRAKYILSLGWGHVRSYIRPRNSPGATCRISSR